MTSLQGAYGWAGPAPIDCLVTNRTGAAVAVGAMLMLDVRRTDADSTSNTTGLATAGLANGITPVSTEPADLSAGIYGICQQAAADNGFLRLRLQGQCDLVAVAGTVVLATDDAYGPATGTTNVTKIAAASAATIAASGGVATKVLFIPLTARTGAGTTDGWFSGVYGFGTILV